MFITAPLPKRYRLQKRALLYAKVLLTLQKNATIVFTIVSDDAALKNICEGENGLLNHLAKESIHISMSTILPQTATDLASLHQQHSQHYLASPVFGRPEAAAEKKLNFTMSGDEKIRKQVEPLLKDAGGLNVWDFGDNDFCSKYRKTLR